MRNEAKAGWVVRARLLAVAVLLAARAMAQEKNLDANNGTTTALVPETGRQVLVSITDRKLALLENGRVVKVYPVAVGASVSPSPTGQFTIITRLVKPTYYHSGKVIEPGPANPLGTRWMGLSHKGYGIHGTNAPRSIGKAASHGCIRMAQADLEELFELVRVGDAVEIRGESDSQTAAIFGATMLVADASIGAAGGQ
jgi:lipoprotein-anchoring transpeptidase ErfK/SrfK